MSWSCEKKSLTSVMLFLCAVFLMAVFNACSESALDADVNEQDETSLVLQDESSSSVKSSSSKAQSSSSSKAKSSSSSAKSSSSSKLEYPDSFKPQDKEYPYAGIPRMVIETRNRIAIKDRETEIPAKMQIWGDSTAESEIMDLTIRGRGNSTWAYPKKPYTIKFEKKQSFLGLPEAKKWVMLANYRDRTLIRNAIAFDIASYTSQKWVPHGIFADVFLNGKPVGNYYITEKISVGSQRLDIDEKSFILEIDKRYDEEYKFKTEFRQMPVNVKYPKNPTSEQMSYIKDYMDSVETFLYKDASSDYQKYIDVGSFADYWIIHELTQNKEPYHPFSVYMYKDYEEKIVAGPVWDFDWQTFTSAKTGFVIQYSVWNDALLSRRDYRNLVKEKWKSYIDNFKDVVKTIDSLKTYLEKSNTLNYKMWPIKIDECLAGDEEMSYEDAFHEMKSVYENRILELDSLFGKL